MADNKLFFNGGATGLADTFAVSVLNDSQWWNLGTEAFQTYNESNIANYGVTGAVEIGTLGLYTIELPTTADDSFPATRSQYNIVIWQLAASSLAAGDLVFLGPSSVWYDGVAQFDPYLDLAMADEYLDNAGEPWAVVKMKRSSGGIGVGTELLRKELFTIGGVEIVSATVPWGQAVG
jgi:hypothetical protein